MSECVHQLPSQKVGHARCALKLFGGQPSLRTCEKGCRSRDDGSPAVAPADTAVELDRRASVCQACEHCRGLVRRDGKFPLRSVQCDACGCGLRRLRDGCPLGRFEASVRGGRVAGGAVLGCNALESGMQGRKMRGRVRAWWGESSVDPPFRI